MASSPLLFGRSFGNTQQVLAEDIKKPIFFYTSLTLILRSIRVRKKAEELIVFLLDFGKRSFPRRRRQGVMVGVSEMTREATESDNLKRGNAAAD